MKITFDEYKKAHNIYYFDAYLNKLTNEEKAKSKEIIDLYRKQNKYNFFQFLEERYSGDNPYSSKAIFFSKSVFVSLFIYIVIILYIIATHYFNLHISMVMLISSTILLIVSLLLYHRYDFLFDDEKYKPEKTLKEKRIAKLKNISG